MLLRGKGNSSPPPPLAAGSHLFTTLHSTVFPDVFLVTVAGFP